MSFVVRPRYHEQKMGRCPQRGSYFIRKHVTCYELVQLASGERPERVWTSSEDLALMRLLCAACNQLGERAEEALVTLISQFVPAECVRPMQTAPITPSQGPA